MSRSSIWQVPLFAGTLFLGAMLLFGMQPMAVRMILPALGGSPSVWTTAQVFFQALLLAGYLYAHLLGRIRNTRRAVCLHLILLTGALLFMPVTLPQSWQPASDTPTAIALLAVLTFCVGLPFFAVTTSAPLLQNWFSRGDHASAGNPYFLYSASNAGGLLALVSYPFLIEPMLGLRSQSVLWAWGYGLLIVLVALSGLSVGRPPARAATTPRTVVNGSVAPLAVGQRLHWVALAFVPSSLMLGVTLHISTDIAAMPFLWLLPLTLYLLTWVITFARKSWINHRRILIWQPVAIAVLATTFDSQHLAFAFVTHLLAFFLCTMMCHGELSRLKPATHHLTEFYLWLSVGGVLGGVFNAIVAPLVFDAVYEYPIALVLAVALRPVAVDPQRSRLLPDVLFAAALGGFYLASRWALASLTWADTAWANLVVAFAVSALLWTMQSHRRRFLLATAIVLLATQIAVDQSQVLRQSRSFLGVHSLTTDTSGQYVMITHGNTVHGLQRRDVTQRPAPLGYYTVEGPIGQFMKRLGTVNPDARIAVIGLGSGAISCLANATQKVTFFEIDKVVVELAFDDRWLRFQKYCGANTDVIVGDGRLELLRKADNHYDVIILDAFSSDAIPAHLLTREALQAYARKLTDDGVMVLHLSNRYLQLAPVAAATAHSAGLIHRVQVDRLPRTFTHWPTTWMMVGKHERSLQPYLSTGPWRSLTPGVRPWTDDYSDIAAAIRWDKMW